jgi:hypothetical protein
VNGGGETVKNDVHPANVAPTIARDDDAPNDVAVSSSRSRTGRV